MVKEKWLDEKWASRGDFLILSWDKGNMISDKIHLGVLTIVKQSGFNNHFYVFPLNPYGPRWRGLSWPINEKSSIWDEWVSCEWIHLFTSKNAHIFTFNTQEVRFLGDLRLLVDMCAMKGWGDILKRERDLVSF